MSAVAALTEAIDKKQYQNNTGGWIGVVTLDHLGRELGVNVPPNGTIWLSDAEAILTSRAPVDPRHNPFEEQEFRTIDPATGAAVYQKVRPISVVTDESRSMFGSDRYVPGLTSDEEMRVHVEKAAREGEGGTVTPAQAARTAQIEREAQIDGSWVAKPEAPGQVLPGRLRGSDEGSPRPTTSAPTTVPAPQQQPVPGPVLEELASVEPDPIVGEETGARTNGHAEVEGEYAAAEETGTDQLGDDDNDEGLIS